MVDELERRLLWLVGHSYRHNLISIFDLSGELVTDRLADPDILENHVRQIKADTRGALQAIDGLLDLIGVYLLEAPTGLFDVKILLQEQRSLIASKCGVDLVLDIPLGDLRVVKATGAALEVLMEQMVRLVSARGSKHIHAGLRAEGDQVVLTVAAGEREIRWDETLTDEMAKDNPASLLCCWYHLARIFNGEFKVMMVEGEVRAAGLWLRG